MSMLGWYGTNIPPLWGGPAFPDDVSAGMSLRDYFAAKAMFALLANTEAFNQAREIAGSHAVYVEEEVAEWAYLYADAMLRHRSGETPKAKPL